MEKNKVTALLYLIAGIIFLLTSILGKNIIYVPIGCCFIVLGISYSKRKRGKK